MASERTGVIVTLRISATDFDALREIVKRDEDNDKRMWELVQSHAESKGRTETYRELQRHQFQRERIQRVLS